MHNKWGKYTVLFLMMAMILSLCGCQQKTDSDRVKEFLSAQSKYDYLNCEITGKATHKVVAAYPFDVHVVSNRNYQDLHMEFNGPKEINMNFAFDYLDGELHGQFTDGYMPLPDDTLKTLIAETYEKGLRFDVLADNMASLKNISIEEKESTNVYSFVVPAFLLPQSVWTIIDFMDYTIPGREFEQPQEYKMAFTADSNHKVSNVKISAETSGAQSGTDEYDLDFIQVGGTIVVKHDILVPHNYRSIQLFTGYDYQETQLEGCECAFVSGPVSVQAYLQPRSQLDRMGWSGHLEDYRKHLMGRPSITESKIIESDFQHVLAEYVSNEGYTAVFGLYDHQSDGFYQVMYLVDSTLIDKYRDEFMKYLKNVVW